MQNINIKQQDNDSICFRKISKKLNSQNKWQLKPTGADF